MKINSIRIYNRIDQHRVFGLIGFELCVENVDALSGAFLFSIDGRDEIVLIETLRDLREGTTRNRNELVVHLNTFVVSNGPATMEVCTFDLELGQKGKRLAAYDIIVDNRGELYARVRLELLTKHGAAFLPALVDSALFGDHELTHLIPWFESRSSEQRIASTWSQTNEVNSSRSESQEPAATVDEAISRMQLDGYCVLPERIPEALCDQLVIEAKAFVANASTSQGYQLSHPLREFRSRNEWLDARG